MINIFRSRRRCCIGVSGHLCRKSACRMLIYLQREYLVIRYQGTLWILFSNGIAADLRDQRDWPSLSSGRVR